MMFGIETWAEVTLLHVSLLDLYIILIDPVLNPLLDWDLEGRGLNLHSSLQIALTQSLAHENATNAIRTKENDQQRQESCCPTRSSFADWSPVQGLFIRPASIKAWFLTGAGLSQGSALTVGCTSTYKKHLMNSWMASPIQWTRTWENSRRWWGTGRPDVLQSMGLQRVEHDWATEHHHLMNKCHIHTRASSL